MKGLLINKYLKKILSEDELLTNIVNVKNIKAMVLAPTDFPFVSFKRNSIDTLYAKDLPYEERIMVDIICVSNDYAESIEIAQRVRDILEYHVYQDTEENVQITYMVLNDANEDTISDSYVQTLTFEIHMQQINK